MRRMIAAGSVAVGVVAGLAAPGEARAQLQPPAPMGQPQPAPAPSPIWNPFAPATPVSPATGQYAGTSATQQQLDLAEKEDSGRGFEIVWANVEGGGSFTSFGSGVSTGGAVVGLGAGVRFVSWTLGVRARINPYSDFTLMQFVGEAGWHLLLGSWDPYAKIRLGYGRTNDIGVAGVPGATFSLHGFDAGLGIGADYYLSALFSLGLEASGDLLPFQSTGAVLAGTAHVGLHFDL